MPGSTRIAWSRAQPDSDVTTFQCPSWRKPATAFAYLNFAEDAESIMGSPRAVLYALCKAVDYRSGCVDMHLQDVATKAGLRCRKACRRALNELIALGVLTETVNERQPEDDKPRPRTFQLHVPEGYRPQSPIGGVPGAKPHTYGVESPVGTGRKAPYTEEPAPGRASSHEADDLDCTSPGQCRWAFQPGHEWHCLGCGRIRSECDERTEV